MVIALHNASVCIADKTLLDSVSTAFECGHVTAILGPNGAGKSTLMALLTGQRLPNEDGAVHWHGQPLTNHPPAQLARQRAFVAQDSQVAFEFTVREVVSLGRYPHRSCIAMDEGCIVDEALHTTQVAHLGRQPVSTLSGGEKARVQLARALAQVARPGKAPARWLLLDEPTAALDLQHQHQALSAVERWASTPETGAVAVLHDLNLALRYCKHCVLLGDGQVVASGLTAEVLKPAQIQALWGVRAVPVQGDKKMLQYLFEPIWT